MPSKNIAESGLTENCTLIGAKRSRENYDLRTISGLKKPTSELLPPGWQDITSTTAQQESRWGFPVRGRRVFFRYDVLENLELVPF